MKTKISVTLDERTVHNILKTISSGRYRNKSHVVEYAVRKFLEKKPLEELEVKGG
jgi:Arc/MetJ-type ribon-helix-helix transcriptional regulator